MTVHKLKCAVLAVFASAFGAAFGDIIQPTGDAATDTAAIQNAINAGGDVELGEGMFVLNDEIKLETGATVSGQGYEKTILKQMTSGKRVMTISGSSTLVGVTLTGGKTTGTWAKGHGAGATVNKGTISWCCISNNAATAANSYGGGLFFTEGTVDHSIIADNTCGGTGFGGGIGTYQPDGAITIDSCLILGNKANYQYDASKGGGIGLEFLYQSVQVTVRNTTIVGNQAGVEGRKSFGGAIYTSGDSGRKFKMLNCILADNTTVNTDISTNLTLKYADGVDYCLFDREADKIGANSKVGDPKFKDAAAGSYMIAVNSPAKGAGQPDSATGTDLAGADYANPPSMGCYEYVVSTAVEAPVFEPESCLFYPSVDVTLANETEGAAIYYTLDESEPTEKSELYDGPITLTGTTTVKARAYKTGLSPSEIVSETYTLEEPAPPRIGEVTVTPFSTSARFSGTIAALGNYGATACDVYLAIGGGEATKVASGAADSFSFVVSDLTAATRYTYVLSIFNNAPKPMGDEKIGGFETNAARGELKPGKTPAETRQAIQDAIDEAALEVPAGTVMLGEGVFEIDEQLIVKGGITLAGQGWTNTVIKQTSVGGEFRCVTVRDGSTIVGVTLTGGAIGVKWTHGAGAFVEDGTISWCCITNNATARPAGNNNCGGGVNIRKGTIDHSIIAHNTSAAAGGSSDGGGIGVDSATGPIVVDTCLVYDNNAPSGIGGGVYAYNGQRQVTVRNTTITENSAKTQGGGVGLSATQLTLQNSIVWNNTATESGEVSGTLADGSVGNLIGEDPTFKDAANGNYRLSYDSPANGIGHWYEGITVDLDGRKRGRRPEAGCYEICPGLIILLMK